MFNKPSTSPRGVQRLNTGAAEEATLTPFPLQVAERCIRGLAACGQTDLLATMYSRLSKDQRGSLPSQSHQAALQAYLGQIQGSSSSTSNSSSSAVGCALGILRRQGVDFLSHTDAGLARTVLSAAQRAIQAAGVQQSSAAVVEVWSKAGKAQDSQALSGCLLNPNKLALWGLRLLHESGADKAELQAALTAAVAAHKRPGNSGQLLALLRCVPDWALGLQPAAADWGALMCAARQDAASLSQDGEHLESSIAKQLQQVCNELRDSYGPSWVEHLGSPAAQVKTGSGWCVRTANSCCGS